MAKDPATLDLLKRLHAGLPVEFVVVGLDVVDDKEVMTAPPGEGYAFAMRVTDLRVFEQDTPAGKLIFRVIAYGHSTNIKDATATSADVVADPSPGEALGLAMEEHMMRHAREWAIGGPIFEGDKKVPGPEGRRAALDGRIQAHAAHADTFYGAIRKTR
jgi:hypothetical protein